MRCRLLISAPTAALAAAAALAALPAGAGATLSWGGFGGDPGHAGMQAIDPGAAPVTAVGAWTAAGDRSVRTSPVLSGGPSATQRVAYGTADGVAPARIHLRVPAFGVAVGPEDGIAVDHGAPDADAFSGAGGSVTPVDTSQDAMLGQLFVLHNDDDADGTDDIALAQIDETSGVLVQDVAIPGTNGYTVSSSPIIGDSLDIDGQRALFFVAADGTSERLFRVAIDRAGTPSAQIGATTSTTDVDAAPLASPALVRLADPAGAVTAYVALATTSKLATLRTFDADSLTPGPRSAGLLPDAPAATATTPIVPVTTTGLPPGAFGAGVGQAPALDVLTSDGATTVAHRLVQQGFSPVLQEAATSPPLPGAAGPAPATDELARATGPSASARLYVPTSANLYALDAISLTRVASLGTTDLPVGFAHIAPAVSGSLVLVQDDAGAQRALTAATLQPLAPAQFAPQPGGAGGTTAVGQPGISRGLVAFGSGAGLFVQRVADTTKPTAKLQLPRANAQLSGTVTFTVRAYDSRSIASVRFLLNGRSLRTTSRPSEDSASVSPGALYLVRVDTHAVTNGTYRYAVEATDTSGLKVTTASRTVRVSNTLRPGRCANTYQGTPFADRLVGTAAGDRLVLGAGDDTAFGLGGDDCLLGGAGRDRLSGGAGRDELSGGTQDDTLLGGSSDDKLLGGAGNDKLYGNAGNDMLYGGPGNDRLSGGAGRNGYSGGAGNDVIDARNHVRETITCGPGRDTVYADRHDRTIGCERVYRR